MDKSFNSEKLIKHWMDSSDKDFKTMIDLYQTNNNNWALFIGHLVIEKLLKALYVKEKNEFPPLIHDLRRIIEHAGLEVDSEIRITLDSISRFNINARYDDYKQSFYKLCTKQFTDEWIEKIKECRLWIKMKL
jgi:HEPN domain-containing protein